MAKRERARPKIQLEPVFQPPPQSPAANLQTKAEFEKRRQYSVWFRPSLYKSIQHEAIDRDLSIGEVLEEAMSARVMLIRKPGDR